MSNNPAPNRSDSSSFRNVVDLAAARIARREHGIHINWIGDETVARGNGCIVFQISPQDAVAMMNKLLVGWMPGFGRRTFSLDVDDLGGVNLVTLSSRFKPERFTTDNILKGVMTLLRPRSSKFERWSGLPLGYRDQVNFPINRNAVDPILRALALGTADCAPSMLKVYTDFGGLVYAVTATCGVTAGNAMLNIMLAELVPPDSYGVRRLRAIMAGQSQLRSPTGA